MRPLRVLHAMWSVGTGGFEVWLRDLLKIIDRRELAFDLLVFAEGEAPLEAEMRALGVRIIRVTPTPHRRFFGLKLAAAIKRHGPYDIVHCHMVSNLYPLLWARLAGVRARILQLHETYRGWPAPHLAERLYLTVLRQSHKGQGATKVLAVSRIAAESWYPSHQAREPYEVFYCGTELKGFEQAVNKDELRRSLGISSDAWVVGHVGRLAEVKNHPLLLQAFARLADLESKAHLLLIGDGPKSEALKKQAASLGISGRVTFAGTRTDVPALMLGAIDHFAFPSLAEGLPISVLQAQAAGLPITLSDRITQEVEVVPGLIQRLTLDAGPDAWAAAMTSHPARNKRNVGNSLQVVRESPFTLEKSARRLLETYRRTLDMPA